MKIQLEIDIKNCTDCPFAKEHIGHGECWTECDHKNHNQGAYGNILWGCQSKFEKVPEWCPLGVNDES